MNKFVRFSGQLKSLDESNPKKERNLEELLQWGKTFEASKMPSKKNSEEKN